MTSFGRKATSTRVSKEMRREKGSYFLRGHHFFPKLPTMKSNQDFQLQVYPCNESLSPFSTDYLYSKGDTLAVCIKVGGQTNDAEETLRLQDVESLSLQQMVGEESKIKQELIQDAQTIVGVTKSCSEGACMVKSVLAPQWFSSPVLEITGTAIVDTQSSFAESLFEETPAKTSSSSKLPDNSRLLQESPSPTTSPWVFAVGDEPAPSMAPTASEMFFSEALITDNKNVPSMAPSVSPLFFGEIETGSVKDAESVAKPFRLTVDLSTSTGESANKMLLFSAGFLVGLLVSLCLTFALWLYYKSTRVVDSDFDGSGKVMPNTFHSADTCSSLGSENEDSDEADVEAVHPPAEEKSFEREYRS